MVANVEFYGPHPSESGRTTVWWVRSLANESHLGEVRWYAPWRRYTFWPASGSIFDSACLNEVVGLMDEAMAARKKARIAAGPK